jgi:non-heme chloroperoxidase
VDQVKGWASASARLSAKLIKNATLKVYHGAPHGLAETLQDRLNTDLLEFLTG